MLLSSSSMPMLQHKYSLFLPLEQYEHDDRRMDLFQIRVCGGLEVRWTALQCVLTIQPTLLSQCRAAEGCKQLLPWKRKALQCLPTPQLCSARVHLCLRTRSSWSELIIPRAHTDEGSSIHRELRLPGAGRAQPSSQARLETGACWRHWCVRTLVAETQLEHELQAALPQPGSSSLEEALPSPWRNNKWQCRKACLLSIHACKLSWAKQWMC